jgi:hypothetical protein
MYKNSMSQLIKNRKFSLIILSSIFLTVIALFSCNQNGASNSNNKDQSDIENRKKCYFFAFKSDTIYLSLNESKDSITGVLNYIAYEKDSRLGTLSGGYFRSDTLFAQYNSTQEGQTSDCEMAMLKKGNGYVLTNNIWGENYTYNTDYTKGSFSNRGKIKFDGEELKPIECR